MKYLTPEDFKRAATYGIDEKLLKKRFYYEHMPKEDAITNPRGKRRKRRYSNELIEKAQSNGICYSTFASRVFRGMDEELAASLPVE